MAPVPEFAGVAPARTVPLGLIALFTTALVLAIGFALWFALREDTAPGAPVAAAPEVFAPGASAPAGNPIGASDGTPALLGIPPNKSSLPQPAASQPAPIAPPTIVPDPTAPLLPPDTVVGSSPVPVEPQAAPMTLPAPPVPAPAIAESAAAAPDPAAAGNATAMPGVPVVAPTAAEAPPPEVVQESPASDLPDLSDLPLAVRQALPPLVLNMHLYRATPADRVVILDGQRLGEGDTAGDIQVAEIRSDGVVLVAKGQRFLLSRLPR